MDADAQDAHAARIDTLLATLDGGADVERRASALSSLGVALDAGPPPDALALVEPVHKALRHSHPSLFVPALASLASLLEAMDSAAHLARAVATWLPPVLERLGDAKERVRVAARGALDAVVAAAMGKMGAAGVQRGENAAASLERLLREVGLQGKSPRVREQVTLHLPSLRAAHKLPLRPLLSPLVDLLSDADGPVREAARSTLLALFGPASGGAKADLKRELEKKGTRKQTADALLASVFAMESETEEARIAPRQAAVHASAPPGAVPTPVMTAAAAEDVPIVHIASRQDLERTLAPLHACFEGRESEHNWAAREAAIVKLRGILRAPGAVGKLGEAIGREVKALGEGIVKGASTLRTTLAMHSLALIGELAQQLGDELPESVADLFLTSLLKMAGFTKKLVATASQQAVACLLRSLAYRHKFLDLLWAHLQEKTVATRIWMCTHLCTLIETHGAQRRHALEAHNGLDILDRALKRALPDQNKDVRAKARDAFFHFQRVWPGEAERLLETLDASTKKQVAAALAEAGGPATAPSSTVGSPAAAGTPGVPAKARSASIAAVPPARRPGGPSSAILAAKRAASERLARERREAEEAAQAEAEAQAQQEGEAPADEEAQAAAEAKADQAAAEEEAYARVAATRAAARAPSTPRERPLSLLDSSPTGIPAPTTRRGHARSASSSSSQQATPRLGSDPAPSSSTPTGVAAATAASRSRAPSASSSSTPPSHGSAARLRGGVAPGASLPPPSSTRTRTASTSSSSASSVSRPTRLRAAAQQDADETTELPAALDDDVSLDLMAFSSSPIAPGPRTGSTSAFARRQAVSAEQARRHAAAAADEARQMQHRLDEPASPIAAAAAVPSASTLPPLDTPAASGTGAPVPGSSAGAEPPGTPGAKPLAPGGAAGGASWFNKRAARLENGGAEPSASSSPIKARPEAAEWVAALASGQADLRIFRRLAKLSADFPVPLASSSTEAAEELTPGLYTTRLEAREAKEALRAEEEAGKERAIGAWLEGGLFDQLWDALLRQLEAEGRSEELHAAALVVLQRLISHQHALLAATNREAALLALLLQLRRRRRERATQSACEALVDAWTARTEPILGLGTLMAALDAALGKRRAAAAAATNGNGSAPSAAEEAARVRVYTLGLRSLGRLLLRLPPELVEEELPRAKLLIKAAFGAPAVELRLAATQVIVAAHARMHDTPTLFRILAPLEESQRDLLTYYISKSTQGGRAGKMVA